MEAKKEQDFENLLQEWKFKATWGFGPVILDQLGVKVHAPKTIWEDTIKPKLLENKEQLLKAIMDMPGGARLHGVCQNGDTILLQKKQEITCGRWTKDWETPEDDKGTLKLLPQSEAIQQEKGRWASLEELEAEVIKRGFYLPEVTVFHPGPGFVSTTSYDPAIRLPRFYAKDVIGSNNFRRILLGEGRYTGRTPRHGWLTDPVAYVLIEGEGLSEIDSEAPETRGPEFGTLLFKRI